MNGVQLCAHYGNLYLDDAVFAPMFEKLNEYGMIAYVHHTPVPVEYESIYDYNNLRRSYGRCVDQAIAVSRELLSGMFEKYPEVKVVHSMLGGGIFTYLNMLVPAKTNETDSVKRFETMDDKLHLWLKENIFFEMSHAQPWGIMLESAIKVLGADHIIYGSSYPVRREWFMEGVSYINSLQLDETEKELILCENAKRLYKIQK
jgi:predicted TIM-barrel fold metal-dependent hydrolase